MIEKRCDLLCIGAGGAGISAAIYASEKGAHVILVAKDHIGYGNTRIIGGTMTYGDLDFSKAGEDLFRDMVVGGDFLNNQRLCRIFAKEAPEATILIERLGGTLKRDAKGEISLDVLMKHGGHTSPRNLPFPSTGPGLGQALRYGVAQRKKIETLEKTIVFDLLTKGNKVMGAVCYQTTRGEIIAIRAKKVLLATGGGGWMYYPRTDNSKVLTGDGYALALHAGAELVDMEQIQFMPFALTHPPGLAGIVVGESSAAGPAGILRNVHGREILPGVASKTRAQVSNAIILEVEKGHGTKYGGCLLDLKGNKNHTQGKIMYEQYRRGIFKVYNDVVRTAYGRAAAEWEEPWDVYPSTHFFMGGIVVNEWGEVKGVENLYACGEVTGGLHGGNRLSGNALTELFIFGKRAGERAASDINGREYPLADKSLTDFQVNRLRKMIGRDGRIRPIELKRELQRTMWEKVGPARQEKKLTEGLSDLTSIEERFKDMRISSSAIYNTDLVDALELNFMLPVAKGIILSALERKESRGAHVRLDHPSRDDRRWLKNIVVSMNKDQPGEMEVHTQPVEFTYLRP